MFPGDDDAALRPPRQVMASARIGSFHQTRLSFVRSLVRRLAQPSWHIERRRFALDDDGFGCAVYQVRAPRGCYSFVAFSNALAPQERSDRVIADKWDTAFVLCSGAVDDAGLARLRANAPLQERGCFGPADLVLSRANKSVRLFEAVAAALAAGRQPSPDMIAPVGYLLRTTAVYGNGKFGLAGYHGVCDRGDFDAPFSAQLFVVYMVRHFSLQLVEHVAHRRAPQTAVALAPSLRRFFGVGNATGLGMAPFLVNHPRLLHRWLCNRERALAWARRRVSEPWRVRRFAALTARAIRHVDEIEVEDPEQRQRNRGLGRDLRALSAVFALDDAGAEAEAGAGGVVPPAAAPLSWEVLLAWSERHAGLEAREALVSLVLEVYPEVNALQDHMGDADRLQTAPAMPLAALKALVERNYDWALERDYEDAAENHLFWYRSEEKEEPRLGRRRHDPGAEREMAFDMAQRVATLHRHLAAEAAAPDGAALREPVAVFLLRHPELRGIVRRVQGLAACPYAEVRENLVSERCRPLDLLRCKLSMFGASKFDPKSELWTRITLFQGAPLLEELEESGGGDEERLDDWAFPCRPQPHGGAGG